MGGFREHLDAGDAGDAVGGLFRLELRFGEKFRGDFCVEVVVFREKHAAADEVLPFFFSEESVPGLWRQKKRSAISSADVIKKSAPQAEGGRSPPAIYPQVSARVLSPAARPARMSRSSSPA